MWNIKLSSVKQLYSLFFISLVACAEAQDSPALDFAEELQKVVARGDVEGFANLPCFPVECTGEEELDYVFGENRSDGFIKEFLSNSDVEIKIFEDADGPDGKVYIVMYFDPELVQFTSEGFLTEEDRERLWWNGYVETVSKNEKGRWGFSRTPFYYGAHLPWAADYGQAPQLQPALRFIARQ